MTFRYPKRLAYLLFIAASVFEILLFVDDKSRSIQPIAWLIIEPLPIGLLIFGIYTFKYSCLIDDSSIIVTGFKQYHYLLADITAINVSMVKGGRTAIVNFKDGRKVSFPNYIDGFNTIVELLRQKTGLVKPRWEESMPVKRKLTRRDLPSVCMALGTFILIGALILSFGSTTIEEKSNLQLMSGTVSGLNERAVKGGRALTIYVKDGVREYSLSQDHLLYIGCDISSIHIGDKIVALVKPSSINQDVKKVWEISRNGILVLSYEQTRKYFERVNENVNQTFHIMLTIPFVLFAMGIVLRVFFGAWKEPKHDDLLV
jgi:hypothetical protein